VALGLVAAFFPPLVVTGLSALLELLLLLHDSLCQAAMRLAACDTVASDGITCCAGAQQVDPTVAVARAALASVASRCCARGSIERPKG